MALFSSFMFRRANQILLIHTEDQKTSVDEKEIDRKVRILNHAGQAGNIAKTCRYFGIPRSLFYV